METFDLLFDSFTKLFVFTKLNFILSSGIHTVIVFVLYYSYFTNIQFTSLKSRQIH